MTHRRAFENDQSVAEVLLHAARDYRASPEMRRRLQYGLGIPVTAAAATTASAAAAAGATAAGVGKSTLVVALFAAGLTTGGVVGYRGLHRGAAEGGDAASHQLRIREGAPGEPKLDDARPRQANLVGASAGEVRAGRPVGDRHPLVVQPSQPEPHWGPRPVPRNGGAPLFQARGPVKVGPPSVMERAPAETAPPSGDATAVEVASAIRTTAGRAPAPTAVTPLAAEIEILNRTHAAARRRDFQAVLAGVAEYDRRFPAGALAEEAEVLRISALFGSNKVTMAAERARAFLARHGDGVLAERVAGMLALTARKEQR